MSISLLGCNDDNEVNIQHPVPTKNTIVDVAVASGDFNTLVAALQATGLDKTLDDENASFTVFAPTDAAFELLGQEAINGLLEDSDALSKILTYHVLASKVNAEAALGSAGSAVETVNGEKIALSLSDGNLLINTSTVTATDINADNGVIHVIDAVLMPPAPTVSEVNIVETAKSLGQFNTLITALETTGLDATLADESGTFTVFAPTDDAFSAIGQKMINTLIANPDVLSQILKQHVLPIEADSITAMTLNTQSVDTVLGNKLPLTINTETDSLLFGGAKITIKDVVTSNGTIHVIDSVIIGEVQLPQSYGTIVDVANEADQFDTLITLLNEVDLESTLADPTKTFTVFAPTDEAFSALGSETLDSLLSNKELLSNILLYHVLPDATVKSDAAIGVANSENNKIAMANGSDAALSVSGAKLFVNDALVSAANIMADNGVIHVLNKVIMPAKAEDGSTMTVAETAVSNGELSTLVSALQQANLVDALSDPASNLTVFAPTNAAFKKLPADQLSSLLSDADALTKVLTQHVVASKINSTNAFAANGKEVTTLAGNNLSVALVDFSGTANSDDDVVTYNSANAILETGQGASMAGKTVYVYDGDLEAAMSQCVEACISTWPPVISNEQGITNLNGLSLVERNDGTMQVAYLGRPLYTYIEDSAAGEMKGEGVNNVWWTVKLPSSGLQIEGSNVIETDIHATNGVIHLIDTVITDVK